MYKTATKVNRNVFSCGAQVCRKAQGLCGAVKEAEFAEHSRK